MRAEVQFGLDDEDPTARTSAPMVEWKGQFTLQATGCNTVPRRGPRMRMQHAKDDLADHIRRQRLDIGIGRRTCLRLPHGRA